MHVERMAGPAYPHPVLYRGLTKPVRSHLRLEPIAPGLEPIAQSPRAHRHCGGSTLGVTAIIVADRTGQTS